MGTSWSSHAPSPCARPTPHVVSQCLESPATPPEGGRTPAPCVRKNYCIVVRWVGVGSCSSCCWHPAVASAAIRMSAAPHRRTARPSVPQKNFSATTASSASTTPASNRRAVRRSPIARSPRRSVRTVFAARASTTHTVQIRSAIYRRARASSASSPLTAETWRATREPTRADRARPIRNARVATASKRRRRVEEPRSFRNTRPQRAT